MMNSSKCKTFKMIIDDVFNFEGGRTVFVGEIRGGDKFIRSCTCQLMMDGKVIQIISIEGEMIPKKLAHNSNPRALSSLDSISWDSEHMAKHKSKLV